MDVTPIANLATAMSQTKLDGEAQMTVLKKAINLESAGAMQLIQSAVQSTAQVAAASSNPPNLGNSVDTFA